MTTERWRRIEDLFHAAGERPPAEREAFLGAECAGDDGLRREVESLLAQQDGTLLRGGLAAAAARITKRQPGELVGRALGDCVLGPLLGMGAMGDVYLARDSKLGRDVAVKILPGALGQHPERLARFRREAQILAALNHPNVAAIYGLEEGDGLTGLVLELVDGETLAEKLRGGANPGRKARALPTEDALTIARQVADGLQAAHRKGIVHRDLKPENIKLTTGGAVKVLDFGLAKIEGDAVGPAAVPALATVDGVLLGTVAYMSPEQARGMPVDKRTDIWAFGCVLYEMLTGSRPFSGDSAADVLAKITGAEPDWTRLPAATPGRVRRLLRWCLAKDPDQRLHDIADARIEIDDAIGRHEEEDEAIASAGRLHAARRRWVAAWVVAAVVTAAAAGLGWFALTRAAPDRPQARLAIPIPPDVSIYAIGRGSSVAVSPDGRLVVYVGLSRGRRQLFVRPLDRSDGTPIQGTENATSPFFSPDGRWIGFIENSPSGPLKKVGIDGGTAVTVADSQGVGLRGFAVTSATWAPDDTIIFSSVNPKHRGLWRVAADGGNPVQLTVPRKGELLHSWPQMVPGRNAVVYTIWNNSGFENGQIAVQSLDRGDRTILAEGASYGRVVTPDKRRAWLMYARSQRLEAAPFDLDRLQVAGSRVPVLDGVLVNLSGGAHFSIADSGLLAFVPGGLDELNKTLLRVAKDGRVTEIGVIPNLGFQYRLSPDGLRLVTVSPTGSREVWIQDLVTRGTPRRLTFGGIHNMPIWTPDGRRVIYSSGESPRNIFWRAADQSGDEERLTTSANDQYPGSVSRDGSLLAYVEDHADRGSDIWLLRLQDPGQRRLVVGTPAGEQRPAISPDGRWMAYQTNVTGDRFEIYLASLAGGAQNVPVSTGGGRNALWSRDGRELFYRTAPPESATGHMMAVSVDTTGAEPKVGVPRALFPATYQGEGDMTPDGDFLLIKPTPQESSSRVIQLVFNWFEYLDEKVPRR